MRTLKSEYPAISSVALASGTKMSRKTVSSNSGATGPAYPAMTRCYEEVSWETGVNFALTGLSLGFDRRVEHVKGLNQLRAQRGVPAGAPIDMVDWKIPTPAYAVRFQLYDLAPRDRRRGSYPAALLYLVPSVVASTDIGQPPNCAELVQRFDLGFVSEPAQNTHDLSHDLVTSWGAEGFAVHVRGARNIKLLGQLHEALLDGDVVVLAPGTQGLDTGPVRLVLVSQMSPAKVE